MTDRSAGIVLGIGAVAAIAFMSHHPTMQSHEAAELIEEMARKSRLNAIVHGTLIAVGGVIFVGLLGLAERLGPGRLAVRAGLVAYLMGGTALIAAAVTSGFVYPGLVSRYTAEEFDAARPAMTLCHEVLIACDHMGVVGCSAAVLLWSLVLLARPGLTRVAGVIGLAAGLYPLVALWTGHLPVSVDGFIRFVIAQAAWYLAIAVQLFRGRL